VFALISSNYLSLFLRIALFEEVLVRSWQGEGAQLIIFCDPCLLFESVSTAKIILEIRGREGSNLKIVPLLIGIRR